MGVNVRMRVWAAAAVRGCAALIAAGCSRSAPPSPTLSTDTDSQALPERGARLAFLARYVPARTPIADAEYVIRYRDNSGGAIPGPSDWDIRAVLQIEGDPAAWHAGWSPCAGADASPGWAQALLARRPAWRSPRAAARCFRDPRAPATIAIVYAEDGLVAYRSATEG